MSQSKYMRDKRVHLIKPERKITFGWIGQPLCRVDNFTTAFKVTKNVAEVDCVRCIMKFDKERAMKFMPTCL